MTADEAAAVRVLREDGARFAFVHGSRARGTDARPDSDLDVAAWWGAAHPAPWEVRLASTVDLLVLDDAPLWLAGRVAQYGRLLFDDDPAARVSWQADTRLRYLDDLPGLTERRRAALSRFAAGRRG